MAEDKEKKIDEKVEKASGEKKASEEKKPAAEKPAKKEKAEKKAKPEKDGKKEKKSAGKGEKKSADKKSGKDDKKEKKTKKPAEKVIPRLQIKYKEEVIQKMMETFKYKNINQVPKIEKVVLNVGMGAALQNSKLLDAATEALTLVSGQKAIQIKAKRSVSNFKLRQGSPIGTKVTLRRAQMFEFLDRFISIAVPRIRDFRGLSDKSFDGFGNYSTGIKEQIIFTEINYDKVEAIHGMDICIVTSAKTDEEARTLLRLIGMPFVDAEDAA